jgi:hypothetical protein
MGIKLKYWFFHHYWWLLPVVFISVICAMFLAGFKDFGPFLTVIGTLLSVIYFIQRQRLEETRLFREIFAECNARYDKLNEKLNVMMESPTEEPLDQKQLRTLVDYFNLCGEEYLYYRQGFLFPEVWRAWNNGMRYFVANPRIAAVWREEKRGDSYYGLPL